ncbi:hypothetical protein EBU91_00460 [bacterium]|jgi:hypothetical protein|nr:hypothetical protein [bacterium]
MTEHRVADEYRRNSLSLKPGGDELTIYLTNGQILTYDKIKNYSRYIESLTFKDDIKRIDLNGELLYDLTKSEQSN